MRLTSKRAGRAAEASGAAAAGAVWERAGPISGRKMVPVQPSPLPGKLYACIDGTGVRVTAKETAGRYGKGADGRARAREARLAVFVTQDKPGDHEYPVRETGSSSYIATIEPASVFADLVKAEGIRRGADLVPPAHHPRRRRGLDPEHASAKFPEATRIAGIYRAPPSICTTWPGPSEFMLGDCKDEWLAARLEDLDYGDIDGICAAARASRWWASRKTNSAPRLATSRQRAPHALPLVPFPWPVRRLVVAGSGARRSSGSVSNSPACAGPSPAQTPSPRSAASRPAGPKTRSGTLRNQARAA